MMMMMIDDDEEEEEEEEDNNDDGIADMLLISRKLGWQCKCNLIIILLLIW